ncbi:MAG: hypothetical protein EBU90_26020 [Proteobacteria bacterium]|nr:hypothetical protein [Pseudomonadota bacterium]
MKNKKITITSYVTAIDDSDIMRVIKSGVAAESSSTVGNKYRSLKEKNSLKKNVVMELYAELHCGTFVKVTHQKNGMYCGDVVTDYQEKPIGSVYFPKEYVKTFEEIPIIMNKN